MLNVSRCSPVVMAAYPNTFPNTPWGALSLPNFEHQWVPNPHSHLINVRPLLLTDTQVVHHTLAQLVSSSRSWEWFCVCVRETISLSYSEGSFKDASILAVPTVTWFVLGFNTELCSHVLCSSYFQYFVHTGFPSSPDPTHWSWHSDSPLPWSLPWLLQQEEVPLLKSLLVLYQG